MTDGTRLVQQRMRNRLMDYLELAGSFDAQRTYDSHHVVNVAHEVINQWEDCVPDALWEVESNKTVYSSDEIDALKQFHRTWAHAASAVPDGYPDLADVHALPEWSELRVEAQRALATFLIRGRLPEDHAIS
ncbi:conserved hypothetical protein [Microbacterium sp. 8M]|uniref:hypothetical protein n=1 Tax=Microbacterium sp. 8M TaxID=2653153 RepID=UPI0012EF4296|nr:hypothetical protein [Microbacterium sp. 8M]VXB04135.1 conserved hypothetical protein [Microbacterium sp. 8M]